MKTIRISLPFFCGFYESIYESSDTEYYAINEEIEWLKENDGIDKKYDDFVFDYETRHNDIANKFISVFKDFAPDFINDIKFVGISSPTYYNYRSDEIIADIDLEDSWVEDVKNFISKNREMLKEKINDDWSTRDGFISFISNDLDEFCSILFNNEDQDQDTYIGIMLEYIMGQNYNRSNYELHLNIAESVLEDIYDSEYVSVKSQA